MLTDEEVYRDYCNLIDMDYPNSDLAAIILKLVHSIRQDEPRINSGVHLFDYMMICDEDDDMDSFYGPNTLHWTKK